MPTRLFFLTLALLLPFFKSARPNISAPLPPPFSLSPSSLPSTPHSRNCRTLAAFVVALDVSFVFVIFAICVLGLDSSELLQRHFGTRAHHFPAKTAWMSHAHRNCGFPCNSSDGHCHADGHYTSSIIINFIANSSHQHPPPAPASVHALQYSLQHSLTSMSLSSPPSADHE